MKRRRHRHGRSSGFTPGAIYEGHTADFTARIHYAMRPDGVWFTRIQERDPRYGYRWTAWRSIGYTPDVGGGGTGRKARLPKGAR